jgi:hypothetical protein
MGSGQKNLDGRESAEKQERALGRRVQVVRRVKMTRKV